MIDGCLKNEENNILFSIVFVWILYLRYFIYDGGNCRHPHRMI